MPFLESWVRPFVPPTISPPALPAQPIAPSPTDAVVSLGGDGGLSLSLSYDSTQSVIIKQDKNFKESGRRSSNVHVENQDDPDQFVDFCRADKVSLTPKSKGSSSSKQSTYDPGGSAQSTTDATTYSFDYPTSTTCKSPSEPPKGCGDE